MHIIVGLQNLNFYYFSVKPDAKEHYFQDDIKKESSNFENVCSLYTVQCTALFACLFVTALPKFCCEIINRPSL